MRDEELAGRLEHGEVETYGDPKIASMDAPIPNWLIVTYIVLPIWGVLSFAVFWNGSVGWLDRGYWGPLQQAANTTFPQIEKIKPEFDDPTVTNDTRKNL